MKGGYLGEHGLESGTTMCETVITLDRLFCQALKMELETEVADAVSVGHLRISTDLWRGQRIPAGLALPPRVLFVLRRPHQVPSCRSIWRCRLNFDEVVEGSVSRNLWLSWQMTWETVGQKCVLGQLAVSACCTSCHPLPNLFA